MKYILATLGGLALTLGMFAGGIAFAVTYLAADPVPLKKPSVDASLVFRTDVIKVDRGQQEYERVEARPVPELTRHSESVIPESVIPDAGPVPEIDNTTTAALPETSLPSSPALSDAHVVWCSERYRSYTPESNSYTPYGGGSRECVSPFSEGTAFAGEEAIVLEASASETFEVDQMQQQASAALYSDEHILSCFERYRSYRPDDNTYQPFGGGPRAQCR